MVTKRKSEEYVIRNPRAGMVCIRFLGEADEPDERIEFTHGRRSVYYWHGSSKKTNTYKEWEKLFWEILGCVERQIGHGIIPGVYLMPSVYYKLTYPRETIDCWERELERLSERVTDEERKTFYRSKLRV